MYEFEKYFSANLQKALKISAEAAEYFGSTYIGSEHLLFGLLNVPGCRACKILTQAGVKEPEYRRVFVRTLDKRLKISGYTPRTKGILAAFFTDGEEFSLSLST